MIAHGVPVFMRWWMQRSLPLGGAVLIALAVAGCGGKREIHPDEVGTPTTIPRDLVMYREARDVFTRWMAALAPGADLSAAYALVSDRTRSQLAAAGVRSGAQFAAWFQRNRDMDMTPFRYRFSRVDVIDIDTRDTLRALITATFVVETQASRIESIGSFILLRQRDAWRVPFGDSGWERGWWQQEHGFGRRLRDEGMSALMSRSLGMQVLYPVTWDAVDATSFRVPDDGASHAGVEMSYLNPATMQKEATVRIWRSTVRLPADTTAASDSLVIEEPVEAVLAEQAPLRGERWRIVVPRSGIVLHAFGAVQESQGSYSTFRATIRQIIHSLNPPD
jgi:hypothetical protein